MAGSTSGQDKTDPFLCSNWLPEWTGWSYLACLLGIAHCKLKFFGVIFWPYNKYNPLLTKLVRLSRLDIGLILFFVFLSALSSSQSIQMQKKKELGQYLAILT